MATAIGFRTAQVVNLTAGQSKDFGNLQGNVLMIEVTNDTAATVNVTINDFPEGGYTGKAVIPVKANTTRQIPMMTYRISADGACQVVAYGM